MPRTALSVASNRSSRRGRRRRRRVGKSVSCGWRANSIHAACLLTALALGVGHFDALQRDAGAIVIPFHRWMPHWGSVGTEQVAEWSLPTSLMGFAAQIMAEKYSTARFTFHSLLALLSWLGIALLHSTAAWIGREPLLMSRCVLSAFLFLTYTTLVALPKKRKHKRRPNTIYSAFSVASTAPSQASSLMISDDDDNDGASSLGSASDVDDRGSMPMDTGDYGNWDSRSVFSDDASTLIGTTSSLRYFRHLPSRMDAPIGYDDERDDDVLSRCATVRSLASTRKAPSTVSSTSTASTNWREPRGEWREATPVKPSSPLPSLLSMADKERTPVRSLRHNIQFLSLGDDGGEQHASRQRSPGGLCAMDLPSLSGAETITTMPTLGDDDYGRRLRSHQK